MSEHLQVFMKRSAADHRLMTSFTTLDRPYCVTCDSQNHIIVSTTSGRLEVYDATEPNFAAAEALSREAESDHVETSEIDVHRPECRFIRAFAVRRQHQGSRQPSALFVSSSGARPDAVVVSDPVTSTVTWYALDGRPLFEFRPSYSKTAIAGAFADTYALSFAPAGIDVDAAGQLFIVDRLNGAVCVFNEHGMITKQLIKSSSAGPVQAVAVTPEGHLVCTEYHDGMTNAFHCVRVYGYRHCSCHSVKQRRV